MIYYFIAKSQKGYGYMYNRASATRCTSKKQAVKIATLLNEKRANHFVKLEDNEEWTIHYDNDLYVGFLYRAFIRNGILSIKKI